MSISSITLRVPVTMVIGPVPTDLNTDQAKVKFGLSHVSRILSDRGIQATVDGKHAIATITNGVDPAETITVDGLKPIDNRAFRVQPSNGGHALELSIDLGTSFKTAATFVDFDFANSVGAAWVDGRIS